MATTNEQEVIEILVKAETRQAEAATQSLDRVGKQIQKLQKLMDEGRISQRGYEVGLGNLASRFDHATAAVERHQQKLRSLGASYQLTAAQRSKAAGQLGFAGINIAQDVIQGGPTAAVNNLIALGGNGGIKALLAEIGPAGAGAFAAIAASAGAAFLQINDGLREVELSWKDIPEIIGNTSHWRALQDGAVGALEVIDEKMKALGVTTSDLKDWYLQWLTGTIGLITRYGVGWDEATAAVKRQHEALSNLEAQQKKVNDLNKKMDSGESAGDKRAKATAGLIGDALADEADAAGFANVGQLKEKLARNRLRGASATEEVTREVIDPLTGEKVRQKKSRLDWARADVDADLASAARGDLTGREAAGRIRRELWPITGRDSATLNAALEGRDLEKERKTEEEGTKKLKQDADRQRKLDKQFSDRARGMDDTLAELDEDTAAALDTAQVRSLRDQMAALPHTEEGLEAMGDLLHEWDQLLKGARRAAQATREGRQRQEAMEKQRDQLARESVPAADQRIRQGLTEGLMQGDGDFVRHTAEGLARELIRGGMDPKQAMEEASTQVRQNWLKMRDEAYGPGEARQLQAPQIFNNGIDFLRSVQASQDPQKMIAENTRRSNEYLQQLVKATTEE